MQGVEGASFQQDDSQYLDALHRAASKECERYELYGLNQGKWTDLRNKNM